MKKEKLSTIALRNYLIFAYLFLFGVISFGADWKNIGPEGGNIGQIIINKSDDNTIIVVNKFLYYGLGCSIWRSIDGGEIYANVTQGLESFFDKEDFLINNVAPDRDEPDVFYVATVSGLFVTRDGGTTYQQLGFQGQNVRTVAISPLDNQLILIGTSENGIYKSKDGGVSWTQVGNQVALPQINYLTFDSLNPLIVYACVTNIGILKSTDEGETWNLLVVDCFPRFLTVDPNDSDTIYVLGGDYGMSLYVSTDGGTTWRCMNVGYPFVVSFAVNPSDSNKLYAGTALGICTSNDKGTTWECSKEQFLGNQCISAITIDPVNPSVVYAGTEGSGIYKSVNAGQVWQWKSKGINASFITKVLINSNEPNTIYAGTLGGGLLRSDDYGKSWQIKNPIKRDSCEWNVFDISSAAAPSTTYIGTGCCLGLFKSYDKGEIWVHLPGASIIYALAVDPNNPEIVYSDIGKSIDGGITWTVIPEMNYAYRIMIDPKNSSIIYSIGMDILKSADRGATFSNITDSIPDEYKYNPRPSFAIDPNNPTTLYAGFNGIFKSIDGGEKWILKGLEGKKITALLVDKLASNIIYAGTLYDGLFKSEDNGENWENISNGLDSGSIFSIEESLNENERRIYVGTALGIHYFSQSILSILSVAKLSNPFRLKISGSNFHSDLKVYIGGDSNGWEYVKYKGSSEIVLKGGSALKSKFPKGVPVEIKIVNGDGGSATYQYTR